MNSVRSCRTLLSLAALAAALFLLPSTPIQADPVDDLLALKRVEHSHLIDCREPFEDAFPDESAVRMIEDGLLATQALKDLYGVSLTWQDLQADLDRMAADSKDPDRLRELFAALGNDPERLAEALVRPRLAPKRLRTAYYWDAGRHREARQLLETARQRLLQDAPLPEGVSHGMMPSGGSGPAARRGLRRSMPIVDPPSEIVETRDRFAFRRVHRDGEGRRKVEVFWTEKRSWFNWWKTARDAFAPAVPMEPDAAYRPPEITAADSHTWTATAVAPGDPECPDVRSRHTALWTGTEVVIWGGSNLSSGVFRSGGRYYPATDDWLTTNTDTESWCPLQREDHVAVWIGLYMLVWGGDDLITALDTGGVYRPLDDVWINCSHMDDSAPAARIAHEAVWTGDEMIVWGGADYDYITYYTEGGRYVIPDMNPVNFHWDTTPMSTTGAPSGRELFAWQYDTSNAEAIAWGGYYYDGGDTWYDDGAAYDSTTNSWSAIDDSPAPGRREVWSSAWTGDALAIWSGYDDASGFTPQDGGLYTPSPTDSWATITGTGAPSARSQHRTTWSDYEVVVWGGFDDLSGLYVNDGGRYSPEVDEWLDLPATGAPSERSEMSLLWLDDMLFIWGGYWWDDINELDVFYQDGALLVLPVATIGTVICGQTTVNAEAGWDGYQWSRDGVDIPGATGQSYDATEDGTYRCQVTDSVDGTISTNPLGIVILPLPEPVITGDDEMCENDPEVILDAGPFVTYQWHLDGGDISGATNQTYGAQPGVPGTYDYTVTVTNAQGCENTSPVHTLTVHPLPTVDAGGGEAECIDHAPWNLSGQTPTGGLWTGDGITDGALGTFDPATAGAGAHVITYTYTDPITGCVNSDTKTVTVWDLPAVEAGGDEEGCEDGSPWNLSGESPSGGTWAGPGIINASLGTFDPADPGAGVGVHVVTYTYTDTNGCVNSDAKNVTVHALPNVDAGGDEEGCLDDAPWNLSGESPSGGTWSGDGITDGFLGTFDPADPSAGVGAHLITYTYTDPITSCVNSDTKTVTVHDIPTVEAGGDEEACLNDVPFNLSGNSPAGGSWSGDGITNSALGTFDPATADVGAHTITYYYQDPATGCDDSDTKTVAVHPLPTPTITGESENTCPDEFVTLTTEAGMTSYQWNLDGGPIGGATGQAWDAVASGSYTVTVVDDNTCSATSAGHAVTIIDCCELPSGYGNNTASDLDPCADTGVQVSWDQDPAEWGDGGAGTRTYDVLRDAAPLQTGIAYGTTSWIDVTGSNGTSYDYSVRYNNGCGESAVTQGAAATDTASTAPSGLTNNTAADQDDCAAGVLVTWTADPADWGDNGIGTRTYDVLRDAAPVASGLVYGTTSWTDTTGVSGQAYTYTVRYNNGCGDSAATTGVSATDTFASDPSSLTNNGGTDRNGCADTGVQITWDADPGDWGDNGIGTRYYDVLRDGIVIIPNISYGTTARVDVTGTNEQDYLYQIRYRNGCGLTADTAGVTLTDSLGFAPSGLSNNAAADLDTCADTGVQVTWDADPADWGDSGSGTRFYHIQRDGGDIATFLTYGTTSYTDTTGVNDQVYTYTVVYRNGCGMTTATAPGADAADESGVAPSGLTNNTATDLDPCDATGVEIAWAQDPADWGDMGLGTRTYDVLRDGSPILTGIAYGTTSHTDTTGTGGQAYTYAVRYVNGCGNTADTPGVSGTDLVGATPSGLTNNGGTDRNGCGDTGVQITWDADPADWGDSGSGTRYYDILRDGIVIIPNVSYGTTARVDVTGTNEQAYLYQVRYKNGCGLTADTAGVSLTDSLGVAPSGLTNNGAIDVDGCASDGVLITWDADPADW